MEKHNIFEQVQSFLHKNWINQGFSTLTPVQEKTIPLMMTGNDLIVESPTGTGKTLAYVIPLLDRIDQEVVNVQTLILAPTRELVMQIQQEITKFCVGSQIRSAAFIGGADIKRQIEKIKTRPHIVVGTPGRVLELTNANKLKLHQIKSIVIDEADQMLQAGFNETIRAIINKTLRDRQLLFFSATIPAQMESIGKELMQDAHMIRIPKEHNQSKQVEHVYVMCEQRDKIDQLRKIANLAELKKAIIFVAETKKFVELASKLRFKGLNIECLHSDSKKLDRENIIRRFRESKFPLLVTTDVAARGLDFQEITHVIHFDLPEERDKYVHRSGRTGRMDRGGKVISIITDREVGRIHSFAKSLRIPITANTLYQGKLIKLDKANHSSSGSNSNEKNK